MMFNQKLWLLSRSIERDAAELGLVFASGPSPDVTGKLAPSVGQANGQARGVYLFGVAEAPHERRHHDEQTLVGLI